MPAFTQNMSITSLFKKATNLLGIGSSDSLKPPPLDGEIIYCKNNVCVHPPAPLSLDVEHYPGYLTLRSMCNDKNTPTLILTWIPNSTLKRNPYSIENSPNRPVCTPVRSPRHEYAKADDSTSTSSQSTTSRQSIHNGKVPASVSEFSLDHDYDDWSATSDSALVTDVRHEEHTGIDMNEGVSNNVSERDKTDGGVKLSSSCKSQCDSGICVEDIVQNNEILVDNIKAQRIGIKVNKLNASKNTNRKHDVRSGAVHVSDSDESFSSFDSDVLTNEEQLAALLNRSKLDGKESERCPANRSVCIEMDGDKLVVVTKQDEGEHSRPPADINVNPNAETWSVDDPLSPQYIISPTSADRHFDPQQCEAIVQSMRTVASYIKSDIPEDAPSSSANPHHSANVHPESSILDAVPDLLVTRCPMTSSSSSTTTSGPDSCPASPYSSPCNSLPGSPNHPHHTKVPDTPGVSHNLTFPHNSIAYYINQVEATSGNAKMCGVFSVDLAQMRSLRLFYSDNECTRGQVVIASRESQYKILHFHHAGLDKLAEIFEEWSLFAQSKVTEGDSYKQFLIVRPQLTTDQCHPEEGLFGPVTDDMWCGHMNDSGQIEEVHHLQKAIFFGGIEAGVRHRIWPFLLHYYSFKSTSEQRERIRNDRYIAYHNIRKARESMTAGECEAFWRSTQCTVEKDVIRTDRSNPYYRGDHNPNIQILQNILLNYAVAHPRLGYTQGMSDLLAPVLAEVQNEADAFWCFEGLMQKTIFVSSPKDHDMDKQLNFLKELIRLLLPQFYQHLTTLGEDGMELLFCHRWILLCFKREFAETEALRMWEACWAHYQTDYFHLFICLSIIAIYGDDILEQNLPADEILLHFSSLAMHMNGDLVLRKARGMLHHYRSLSRIPCTLHTLCSLCGTGMWDSGYVPTVECTGHANNEPCSYTPLSPT